MTFLMQHLHFFHGCRSCDVCMNATDPFQCDKQKRICIVHRIMLASVCFLLILEEKAHLHFENCMAGDFGCPTF